MLAGALDPIEVVTDPGGIAKVIDLDLSRDAIGSLCTQTIDVAWKFFIFAALVSVIVEAFGRSPIDRRDYAGVAWRVVLISVLLRFYAPIFSTVPITAQAIADQFKPMDANAELSRVSADYFKSMQGPATGDQGAATPPTAAPASGFLGGMVYEGAIHVFITAAQALFWALGLLSRIAVLLFYVIGPLALVASIPRPSQVGTRWFGHFVGIACWPIFSALLVRILLAIGISGFYAANAFGHVCVAVAMALCALAVPILSSTIIGGAATTMAQQGLQIAARHASNAASAISSGKRMATNLAGGAKNQTPGGGHGAPQNPPGGGQGRPNSRTP